VDGWTVSRFAAAGGRCRGAGQDSHRSTLLSNISLSFVLDSPPSVVAAAHIGAGAGAILPGTFKLLLLSPKP
jgi:hypothetical protein